MRKLINRSNFKILILIDNNFICIHIMFIIIKTISYFNDSFKEYSSLLNLFRKIVISLINEQLIRYVI